MQSPGIAQMRTRAWQLMATGAAESALSFLVRCSVHFSQMLQLGGAGAMSVQGFTNHFASNLLDQDVVVRLVVD